MKVYSVFDRISNAYDGWYDQPEGKAIFHEELDCLGLVWRDYSGRWLEVGVGTGRFAKALGIANGVDLSREMASIAARRGVSALVGRAEQLPFRSECFDGVLMALTLCFLENPEAAFMECARVLRRGGKLVVGTVPSDSPWGAAYEKKKNERHPVYSHARFRTVDKIVDLAGKERFALRDARSALFWGPDSQPGEHPEIRPGIVEGAGFVGLLFEARKA